MSLAAQLLVIFVSLVAGSTIVLTVAAYRSSLASLETDAKRAASVAAQTRDDEMTRLFGTRRERAEGFLAGVESLCGERRSDGAFGFSDECVRIMVQEFRTTERASGVQLMYRGLQLATAGDTSDNVVQPGGIASVVRTRRDRTEFRIVATRGPAVLLVEFDGAEITAMFAQRAGLGEGGEVFLTDAARRPLTPLRFAPPGDGNPGVSAAEPLAECENGPNDQITEDYRGVRTVHAFRPASVLGGGCIDAHVNYAEALAPSESLREELVIRGAAFVLMGAVLSVFAAKRIAAPVRRLSETARRIKAGRFDEPVPIGGPSEVQMLGLSLSSMAQEIDKLVRREQAARRDAESANRSKDHFLATLSHELRTPLNAIFGWTRLLRNASHQPQRVERATIAIERSTESLRRLVDDLLDVSRIISGRLRLVRAPIRLLTVIEGALDAVRPQAAERRVQLESSVTADDVIVLGDQQRLQHVVWNLLWNAIKFTPEGGLVRLTLRQDGEQAALEVQDTGVGIPAESLPQIFGWFQQAEAGERAVDAGLGVGLALVKQIVELHGGHVSAESSGAGQGATFTVKLPLLRSHDELDGQTQPRAAGHEPGILAGLRVLIVEDDLEWGSAAVALLTEAGAEVKLVADASDARSAMAGFGPRVLVSDIAMPQEDGYSLMQSLRESGTKVPAIALTAFARREDALRARDAGFDIHMAKPVDPERLVHTIAALASKSAG
jgi:signal transduction histidine kinase/CheY-like chemotaxis protein